MVIHITHDTTGIMFAPVGRLDSISSTELQEAIISAFDECLHVVLDFEKLSYISSAGLRVLLMAHKTAVGLKGSLTIRNVSGMVREVLELAGFWDVISIEAGGAEYEKR